VNYRERLIQDKAKRDLLIQQKREKSQRIDQLTTDIEELKEARNIINAAQMMSQVTVSEFIEEVVTLALQSVLGPQYGFKVEYELKRGKSEASLYIVKNGELLQAEDDCGGAVADVASLGLRASCWALSDPKPAPVLLVDEPGRFLHLGERMQKFGELLRQLNEMLGLQIIMITHEPTLVETADKAFSISQSNGISQVEVL